MIVVGTASGVAPRAFSSYSSLTPHTSRPLCFTKPRRALKESPGSSSCLHSARHPLLAAGGRDWTPGVQPTRQGSPRLLASPRPSEWSKATWDLRGGGETSWLNLGRASWPQPSHFQLVGVGVGVEKEHQDVQMITGEREGCGATSSGRRSGDWGRSFPFGTWPMKPSPPFLPGPHHPVDWGWPRPSLCLHTQQSASRSVPRTSGQPSSDWLPNPMDSWMPIPFLGLTAHLATFTFCQGRPTRWRRKIIL